jgi:hypothetical protein
VGKRGASRTAGRLERGLGLALFCVTDIGIALAYLLPRLYTVFVHLLQVL